MTRTFVYLLFFLVLMTEQTHAYTPVQIVCDPGVGKQEARLLRRTKALSAIVSGINFVKGTSSLGVQHGRWVKAFNRDVISTKFTYTYAAGSGRQEVGTEIVPDLDPTILAMCLEAAHNLIDTYCYRDTPSGRVTVKVEKHDLEELAIDACPLNPEKTYCFLGFGETTSILDPIFGCRFPGCYMLYPHRQITVFS